MNIRKYHSPPEWALEAEKRLKQMRVYKTTLAKLINVNYTLLCNVFTGYIKRPDIQKKILAGIRDLEKEGA